MIPKVIHYCWFGKNKYPNIVKKCMASWCKFCPDYELKLWNEDNFDISKNKYAVQAYEAQKWAFVSDYARLDIIYNYGGIYLDTDVELIKPLDDLLSLEAFVSADGNGINTGIGFGAAPGNIVIKEMLAAYEDKEFNTPNGFDLTPCTKLNTQWFLDNNYKIGTRKIMDYKDIKVFPPEYFNPIIGDISKLETTKNTYAIHWGSRLWETGLTRFKANLRMKLGINTIYKIKKIIKKFKRF